MPTTPPRCLLLLLACVLLSGCLNLPVTVAQAPLSLGFRRLVASEAVSLQGQVRVPAVLVTDQASLLEVQEEGSEPRLNEVPLSDATVDLLDATGQPLPAVQPVKTDGSGHFALRGLPGSEAFIVRATFTDNRGRTRVLMAFATLESSCLEVNLATTLVAAKLRQDGSDSLDFTKLPELVAAARRSLPALLDRLNGHRPALSGETELLLDDLIGADAPRSGQAADQLLDKAPGLKTTWQESVSASLDVGFTIQAVGVNQAHILTPQRLSRPMAGTVELVCKPGGAAIDRLTFWLNNEEVTEAVDAKTAWVAQFDTRRKPDGPYVLSAVAEEAGTGEVFRTQAFIYINNSRLEGGASCGSETP